MLARRNLRGRGRGRRRGRARLGEIGERLQRGFDLRGIAGRDGGRGLAGQLRMVLYAQVDQTRSANQHHPEHHGGG